MANQMFTCRDALALLLDQVGFDEGACALMEPVGACIPKEVLPICRAALAKDSQAALSPAPATLPPFEEMWEGIVKQNGYNVADGSYTFRLQGARGAYDACSAHLRQGGKA